MDVWYSNVLCCLAEMGSKVYSSNFFQLTLADTLYINKNPYSSHLTLSLLHFIRSFPPDEYSVSHHPKSILKREIKLNTMSSLAPTQQIQGKNTTTQST